MSEEVGRRGRGLRWRRTPDLTPELTAAGCACPPAGKVPAVLSGATERESAEKNGGRARGSLRPEVGMADPRLMRALRALVHAQAVGTGALGLLLSATSASSVIVDNQVWLFGLVLSLGPLAASVGALRALAPRAG